MGLEITENVVGGSPQEVRPGRVLHFAAEQIGADTTLFFLHGGGGNKEQWRFQWRYFSDGDVNLVAWDALGHGKSPVSNQSAAYAGAESLADALAIFAKYRTARNILVAHSLGTRLALAWLQHDPSGIDAAVLLGAAPLGALAPARRGFPGSLVTRLPPFLLELTRPWLSRAFARLAWHKEADPELVAFEQKATHGNRLFVMRAILTTPLVLDQPRLAELVLPIRILAGDSDGLTPVAGAEALRATLPNATLEILPKTGHQIMLERPAETNAAIALARAALHPG